MSIITLRVCRVTLIILLFLPFIHDALLSSIFVFSFRVVTVFALNKLCPLLTKVSLQVTHKKSLQYIHVCSLIVCQPHTFVSPQILCKTIRSDNFTYFVIIVTRPLPLTYNIFIRLIHVYYGYCFIIFSYLALFEFFRNLLLL